MLKILAGEIRLTDVRTRIPARYGTAVVTHCPCAFVKLTVEFDGRPHVGIASDLLPPLWFTKDPGQTPDDEVRGMLRVIEHALQLVAGLTGREPFDLWWDVYQAQHAWAEQEGLAPLLANFGVTLVERALLEAACRAWNTSFATALITGRLAVPLDRVHPELRGVRVADLLPSVPRGDVLVRQTVGIGMPLVDADIPAAERLNDGLSQSLAGAIDRYGLRHFKIKLSGDANYDRTGLLRILSVIAEHAGSDYAFSLDGNECFDSVAAYRHYWEQLWTDPTIAAPLAHLLFVEQPLHRNVALADDVQSGFRAWSDRPSTIIDESDAEIGSCRRAIELGYAGTSHKNCKGVFKSILSACYLNYLRRTCRDRTHVFSGEDMGNIGPVALLQDLAVAAALGIESVERNGHHYFAGLSMFPEEVGRQVLAAHPDLYEPSPQGWPTPVIRSGRMILKSVNKAPLGVGFELDLSPFESVNQYRRRRQL
jgi:hypothetical protein